MVMAVGEMEIADERRRSLKLHDFDMRPEQGDGRAARPYAGHPRRDRLAEVVRRRTGKQELLALLKPLPGRGIENLAGRQNGRQRKKQWASASFASFK
jgi:hypothetical protein